LTEKNISAQKLKHRFAKAVKYFFVSLGVFAFAFFVLSFTDVPFYAYYYLGATDIELENPPDVIVVLGGVGMPSPDGLIRTYYAADAATTFSAAKIIIALPYNEDNTERQLKLMAHELQMRGIDSTRISFEPTGFNTHSQAEKIAATFGDAKNKLSVSIITSPEHMYRSIKTFKKVGFAHVGGVPAFEKPVDAKMILDKENTKDVRVKSLSMRYNMWSYMNYELIVLREYCAITYYKVKGWI
jgi:uncharacterized SAM-binding protein YcdF (DUF218 family)